VRIRLDIPDRTYSKLKKKARRQHRTVADLIIRSVRATLAVKRKPVARRIRPPVIESDKPGSLDLNNAKIYELIDFP
jgi:hypothetical protein